MKHKRITTGIVYHRDGLYQTKLAQRPIRAGYWSTWLIIHPSGFCQWSTR